MDSIEKIKGTFGQRPDNKKSTPSGAAVRRLPRYYRYLTRLLSENVLRISSSELAARMGVTASQIRQDFNCFGDFGQQGYGYNVKYLAGKVGELLGMGTAHRAVLIGVGNMGHALLSSQLFIRRGITCLAAFDIDPALVGTSVGTTPILHRDGMSNFCRGNRVDLAVLTLPATEAQAATDELAAAGVRGILNFTYTELVKTPPLVAIQNIHLDDPLMVLCYELGDAGAAESAGEGTNA